MLCLKIKADEIVTISNPDGTTTELRMRATGSSIRLLIVAPREYEVSRIRKSVETESE